MPDMAQDLGPDLGPDVNAPIVFLASSPPPPPSGSHGANVSIYGPTQIKIIGPGADAFVIKQGDTLPWLRAQLLDGDDSGVDLTGAEVRLHVRQQVSAGGPLAGTMQVSADCVLDNAQDGKVSYRWQAQDTAIAGAFVCDFRVLFPDGTALSFPNASEFTLKIEGSVALTAA